MHDAGHGRSLVHCRSARVLAEIPSWLAHGLRELDGFDSLAGTLAKLRSLARGVGADVEPLLARLVDAGLLVSDQEVLARLRRSRTPRRRTPLATMGMLTCDRAALLLENLEGFIAHHLAYGHRVEYLVADASREAEARRTLRRGLARLSAVFGVAVHYAGPREKHAYAHALAHRAGVPLATTRFALTGARGCGTTAGANRNAILLHDVNAPILMVDDDIGCELTSHPDRGARLRFAAGISRQVWLYGNRSELHRAHPRQAVDSLALHDRLLMRSAGELSARDPGSVSFEGVDSSMLDALLRRPHRIVATSTGVVGDSGLVDDPLVPASWYVEQLSQGKEQPAVARYRALRRTRLACLVPRDTTLALGGMAWMSGCAAYAPARELPPFCPVGRGQDGLFAIMTRLCRGDALFAVLPWAADHRPPSLRVAASVRNPIAMDLSGVLFRILSWTGTLPVDPDDAIVALGRRLTEAGTARFEDFAAEIQAAFIEGLSRLMAACERLLERRDLDLPPTLRADVERYRRSVERAVFRPPTVAELAKAEPDTLAAAQRIVRSLGALLESWPALLSAASSLRMQGVALFHPCSIDD